MSLPALADAWIWLAILGVAGATVLTRATLLLAGERLRLPPLADRALAYAPACALAAIVVPDLVLSRGELLLALGNYRLIAALVATAAFVLSRSLLATIAVGMAVFTALRLLL
jgi:branched-subunit amino acid transport protein